MSRVHSVAPEIWCYGLRTTVGSIVSPKMPLVQDRLPLQTPSLSCTPCPGRQGSSS